jgi:hypothetical protein
VTRFSLCSYVCPVGETNPKGGAAGWAANFKVRISAPTRNSPELTCTQNRPVWPHRCRHTRARAGTARTLQSKRGQGSVSLGHFLSQHLPRWLHVLEVRRRERHTGLAGRSDALLYGGTNDGGGWKGGERAHTQQDGGVSSRTDGVGLKHHSPLSAHKAQDSCCPRLSRPHIPTLPPPPPSRQPTLLDAGTGVLAWTGGGGTAAGRGDAAVLLPPPVLLALPWRQGEVAERRAMAAAHSTWPRNTWGGRR